MKTKQAWKTLMLAVAGLAMAAGTALGGMEPGTPISPFGFSFVDGAQLPRYGVGIIGLRFSLFSGANVNMYGLSVGVLSNGKEGKGGDGDLGGLQIAGLVNDAYGAEYGAWQICALWNHVRGGGGNLIQLAGFHNCVEGPARGLQLTAGKNEAGSSFEGVQLAGIWNVVDGDFCGVQLALVNVVHAKMTGIQIGAINYAKTPNGIQIGAFNGGGRDMTGLSVGAFNFNTDTSALWPLLRVGF